MANRKGFYIRFWRPECDHLPIKFFNFYTFKVLLGLPSVTNNPNPGSCPI